MRRILSLIIVILMLCCLMPFSFGEEYVGVEKVYVETYPDKNSGNDLPRVGQSISDFYASTITGGISVQNWTLIDEDGVTCSSTVENKNYNLYINVVSNISNYVFTSNTKAYINGVSATITPSGDGHGATLSRNIKPSVIDPVIYKNPGDENHDKGSTFSFTASASQVFMTYQWYIMSTYGEKYTPEELSAAYPGVVCSVKETGSGSVRLNITNPYDGMNGWLVYCTFTGASGNPVATSKATMTIKGAKEETITPLPVVTETPEVTETVDGIEVPEGITIVETPTPEITIVETPTPTAEIEETPVPEIEAAETESENNTSSIKETANLISERLGTLNISPELLRILKYVGIGVGAVVVLSFFVMFIQYLKAKRKAKRRAKMAGRRKGKH